MKKRETIIIVAIILVGIITTTLFLSLGKSNKEKIIPTESELKTTEIASVNSINVGKILKFATLTSVNSNESVLLVKDSAYLTLRDSSITKNSGESTNLDNAKNIGENSAIVVTYGSMAKIIGSTISTNINGSNAIYGTGQKSEISIEDSTLETLSTNSSALVANNKSIINAKNITLTTKVKKSPALETLNDSSTINVYDSLLETNGNASPIINSLGIINLNNTTGTANGSRIAILSGNSNVTLTSSTLLASGGSNEQNYKEAGILIYQKENKDKKVIFNANKSSLNINQNFPYYKIAPLFLIDQTATEINLTNTSLNFGSNIFADIKDSNVTINSQKENITGHIVTDNLTTLTLKLSDHSSYKGKISICNSKIILDKTSTLTLEEDTYITSLENEDKSNNNINFNGFKLFVNSIPIN